METAGRRSPALWLLLLVLLVAGRDGPRLASALAVTVHDQECVYEYVIYEGDTVSGNFVVVDHDIFWTYDHPGIDLMVTSPGGNTVHSVKGTSGDKFEFKAPRAGMYKFCFHNPSSTPETVSFYIHVGHIPNEHNLAKDEHLDPVNVKIAQLREALESVTAEQRYLRAREVRHRHMSKFSDIAAIFDHGNHLLGKPWSARGDLGLSNQVHVSWYGSVQAAAYMKHLVIRSYRSPLKYTNSRR